MQIEVKGDPKFDYETKDTYMVTLTARDNYGETADLELTIMITDVNDAPEVTGPASETYSENGTGSVATYSADDPEGSAIASWSLAGADAGDFKIEDGVLSFTKSPDYETPKGGGQEDDDTDNIYMVTVQATDATKRVGTKQVTVEVMNVEEGGSMSLSAVQPQAGPASTSSMRMETRLALRLRTKTGSRAPSSGSGPGPGLRLRDSVTSTRPPTRPTPRRTKTTTTICA